jgi:hypothetical protein
MSPDPAVARFRFGPFRVDLFLEHFVRIFDTIRTFSLEIFSPFKNVFKNLGFQHLL